MKPQPQHYSLGSNADRSKIVGLLVTAITSLDLSTPWEVVIRPVKLKHSPKQLRTLWWAIGLLHKETGNDKDDLHDYWCGEFFGWVRTEVMGRIKLKPARTFMHNEEGVKDPMHLDQAVEMFDLMQRRSAQTMGIVIPDPDPNYRSRIREELNSEQRMREAG